MKVLSNFHSPEVAVGGVKRKQRGLMERGSRIKHLSMFHCKPSTSYCETYYLIDKGNGAEAKFDLGGESHLHGWSPKLVARLFNMNLNNAYKIYCVIA